MTPRGRRLMTGDGQFGHAGRHYGDGTETCPTYLHHHHDEFCANPTPQELRAASERKGDER